MAKYSDIKGFTVQTLSTDTVASRAGGGSWSSGGDLNTARSYLGGAGISTAALAIGGYTGSYTGKTESYNGTAWTETTDLNTTRAIGAGAGTYTAAIYFGGSTDPTTYDNTESWNGSTWTEVNDLNEVKTSMMSGGTSTAAICAGGSPNRVSTEIWDGTNWTEVNNIPSVLLATTGGGSATSAIIATGQTNPPSAGMQSTADSWDGTNWSEISPVNTARYQAGGTGFQPGSSNTDVMIFGGGTPSVTGVTEFWDGSSWTEIGDMSTARGQQAASDGTSNDAIVAGGNTGSYSAATEEWTAPATFTKQIEGQLFFNSTANAFKETISDIPGTSWSSGGSLNEARTGLGSSRNASSNASVSAFGGFNASGAPLVARDETELYNGTAWTEVADMNTARGQVGGAGTSSTSAIVFGGEVYPNPSNQTITETWDGSSWTETAEMNTAGRSFGNTGTQTNAFCVAGTPNPSRSTKCELWNGSAWTEVNDYPTAKNYVTVAGIYTAALGVGGTPSPFTEANTWDGTSWTEITSAGEHSGTGQGFGAPAPVSMIKVDNNSCEFWNGSSWTEINDLSTARQEGGASGATTNGLVCGGSSPTTGATEEFEVNLANKTITAS